MTHLMEPALPALPGASKEVHDDQCVFCKATAVKGDKSFIGADNDSSTLEHSLAAQKQPRRTFKHTEHGDFSSEPHHLMPGNEALKGHDVEQWLATRASGSQVKADTGFDINAAFNGAWLPSIPTHLVGVKGGWSWTDETCKQMAIDLMTTVGLQFHKGGHTNKGGLTADTSFPEACYIRMVERRLNQTLEHVEEWADKFCPIAKKAGDEGEKRPPPFYLNDLLYRFISAWMMKEVSGAPETWKVFISRVAYAADLEAMSKLSTEAEPTGPASVKRQKT